MKRLVKFCAIGMLATIMTVVSIVACTVWAVTATPSDYASAVPVADPDGSRERMETTLARLALVAASPRERAFIIAKLMDAEDTPASLRSQLESVAAEPGTPSTLMVTQTDLNGWIASEESASGREVGDIRFLLSEGQMTLAGRVRDGNFSAVLSITVTPKVAGDDLQLEVDSVHVGHLPLPVGQLARFVSKNGRLGHGTTLHADADPPRIDIDLSRDANVRLAEISVVDGGLLLTVEAAHEPPANEPSLARTQ